MKNIIRTLLVLAVIISFVSCEKDENQIVFEGGTAPALTANKTTIPLSFVNKDQEAIRLSWTNPGYKFSTGVSSQDVSYTLEIDTTGANFTNPLRQTITIAKDLSKTFTQGELNAFLLNQMLLKPDVSHQIEIRVTSSLSNNNAALRSNVLKFTVTPFSLPPAVAPPTTGRLFLVGGATPGGWNNPVPEPAQEFTKISNTVYEITVPLSGGGSYLFLPLNGSWSEKFGGSGANNTNNVNGGDFKNGGGDLLAPPASGTYKIVVDFQRGKFTVTKL